MQDICFSGGTPSVTKGCLTRKLLLSSSVKTNLETFRGMTCVLERRGALPGRPCPRPVPAGRRSFRGAGFGVAVAGVAGGAVGVWSVSRRGRIWRSLVDLNQVTSASFREERHGNFERRVQKKPSHNKRGATSGALSEAVKQDCQTQPKLLHSKSHHTILMGQSHITRHAMAGAYGQAWDLT